MAQTESCFKSFAAKLGLANLPCPPAASSQPADGGGCGAGGSPSDGAKAGCGWATLAERVLARGIEEQPAMLKAGQLREYQMHVSAHYLPFTLSRRGGGGGGHV